MILKSPWLLITGQHFLCYTFYLWLLKSEYIQRLRFTKNIFAISNSLYACVHNWLRIWKESVLFNPVESPQIELPRGFEGKSKSLWGVGKTSVKVTRGCSESLDRIDSLIIGYNGASSADPQQRKAKGTRRI